MARTLAAAVTTAKDARGNRPRVLVRIDWNGGAVSRLAELDLAFNAGGGGGASDANGTYDGRLRGLGELRSPSQGGVETLSLEVINVSTGAGEFLDTVEAATPPEGSRVRVWQWFAETAEVPANLVTLFDGVVDDGAEFDELTVRLHCATKEVQLPAFFGRRAETADFANLRPDDAGKVLPTVYGAMKGAPTRLLKRLRTTTLRGTLLRADTTVDVEDTTGFPSAGTLDVGEEKITYAGISGNVFTGATRGAAGTVALDQPHGEAVREAGTEVYCFAGHPVKAIANVRVEGQLADAALLTVRTADSVSFPAFAGNPLATVTFAEKPTYKATERSLVRTVVGLEAAGTGNNAVNATNALSQKEDDPTAAASADENDSAALSATANRLVLKRTSVVGEPGEFVKCFLRARWFVRGDLSGLVAQAYVDGVAVAAPGGIFPAPVAEETKSKLIGEQRSVSHDHASGASTHQYFPDVMTQNQGAGEDTWVQPWNLGSVAGITWNEPAVIGRIFRGTKLNGRFASPPPGGTYSQFRVVAAAASRQSGPGGLSVQGFVGSTLSSVGWSGTETAITVKRGPWQTLAGLTAAQVAQAAQISVNPAGAVTVQYAYLELVFTAGAALVTADARSHTRAWESLVDVTAQVGTWAAIKDKNLEFRVVSGAGSQEVFVYTLEVVVENFPYVIRESEAVTADVDGYADDGAGTYTGTPNALIENPADVLHHLLRVPGGLAAADIDAASFAAARASLAALAYLFAGVLLRDEASNAVLLRLAEQCRSLLYFEEGQATLTFQPLRAGEAATLKTLTKAEVLADLVPQVARGARDQVMNEVVVRYAFSHVTGRWDGTARAVDAASQATYGVREHALDADFLRAAAPATDLAGWFVNRYKDILRTASVATALDSLEVERADIVALTWPEVNLAAARFKVLEIERSFHPADRLVFKLREV